jgi:hypothetical protein
MRKFHRKLRISPRIVKMLLDFLGAQPQFVFNLVEHKVSRAVHSVGTPDSTAYAAFLNSGSLPTTTTISETIGEFPCAPRGPFHTWSHGY